MIDTRLLERRIEVLGAIAMGGADYDIIEAVRLRQQIREYRRLNRMEQRRLQRQAAIVA